MAECAPAGRSPGAAGAVTSGVAGPSLIDEGGCLPVRGAHAHALVSLQRLALGLQGRRDNDLGAIELSEVLVPARRHRGAQPAEEVEGAVVLARRPDEDLLQGSVLRARHAGAARQSGMEGGHTPVKAA